MNALTAGTASGNSAGEASALAHKLAAARRELVEEYERHHGLSGEEAVARVREFDNAEHAEQILSQPLRTTTWHGLDQVAAVDPELAAERWTAMVSDAVEEIKSGHRAATVLESGGSQCWDRAQFIAGREHLARDWQPRNGVESSLIDALSMAQHLKIHWMQRMIALDTLESSDDFLTQIKLPRVSSFQAIEQAASMVDRFDRMFMRALRQLRDLRRYMPIVVVQHANQVNVGEQQLNLATGRNETGNEPDHLRSGRGDRGVAEPLRGNPSDYLAADQQLRD